MLEQTLIIGVLLLFLLVGFWIKNKRIKTVADFSINKNNLGWFQVSAGISMTYAGGASLLTMPSLGYSYGWYALIDPITLFLGVLIALFFIKKYRSNGGITISDLLAQSDKKLTILIGIVSTFVFLLILAAQFLALFKLISPYFPQVSSIVLTVVPAILVFSYVFLGGLSSVTKTDILQLLSIVIFLLLPVIYFTSVSENGTANTAIASQDMPVNLMVLLALPLVFIPVSQDINIRVKSAKNQSVAAKGLFMGALIYCAIIIVAIFIGISLAKNGVIIKDSEQAISVFFMHYYPQIGIFAILAVMAAIISTLDSYSLNTVTALSKDILPHLKMLHATSDKHRMQIAGVFVFIVAISIALFFNGVLALVLAALLVYISILIPIALGKKMGVSDYYIFVSSLLLIAIIAFFEVMGYDIAFKPFVYPAIGVGLMGVFLLVERFSNTISKNK